MQLRVPGQQDSSDTQLRYLNPELSKQVGQNIHQQQ